MSRARVAWIGDHLILGLGLLVLAYTFVPIAIVVLMSFNDSSKSRNVYKFQKFTWDHWLHPRSWANGMADSVLAEHQHRAACATARCDGPRHAGGVRAGASPVRGSLGGQRHHLPADGLAGDRDGLVAAGAVRVVRLRRARWGSSTILIAHIMFCLSFVIVTVKARLTGLNDNLEQAAMDLYATESQTFWRVTFPLVLPGIIGAALLSFSLSFDDFIITNLNAGQRVTFPMFVYGANQRGVPMEVNVIGTAMFVISIVIVVGNEVVRRRQEKALAA